MKKLNYIYINQDNSVNEKVTARTIRNMAQIVALDNVDLRGKINSDYAYKEDVDALNERFGTYLTIVVNKEYLQSFSDPEVRRIILSNYGDVIEGGEKTGITKTTFGKTTLKNLFKGNKYIESFEEFENCAHTEMGVTGTLLTFSNCSNLKKIKFPNSLTKLNRGGYGGYDDPKDDSGNWDGAFARCRSLSGILDLNKTTYVGMCSFMDCRNLEGVVGKQVTTIFGSPYLDHGTFYNNNNLKFLFLPKARYINCASTSEVVDDYRSILGTGLNNLKLVELGECQNVRGSNFLYTGIEDQHSLIVRDERRSGTISGSSNRTNCSLKYMFAYDYCKQYIRKKALYPIFREQSRDSSKIHPIGGSVWQSFMSELARSENYTLPEGYSYKYEYINYLIYGLNPPNGDSLQEPTYLDIYVDTFGKLTDGMSICKYTNEYNIYVKTGTPYVDASFQIISGSEYATITNNTLSIKNSANNNEVTIKATLTKNPNIYSQITIRVTNSNNVEKMNFQDQNVADVIFSQLVPDETGTIDFSEQSVCSAIGRYYFYKNSNIEYFNEFSKFSNTALLGDMFNGCTNLKELDTSNITTVEGYAINSCTSLISLNLNKVTTLPVNALRNLSSLTELKLNGLKSATSTWNSRTTMPIYNCSSLKKLELPNYVGSTDGGLISSCRDLKVIYMPSFKYDTRYTSNVGTYAAANMFFLHDCNSVEIAFFDKAVALGIHCNGSNGAIPFIVDTGKSLQSFAFQSSGVTQKTLIVRVSNIYVGDFKFSSNNTVFCKSEYLSNYKNNTVTKSAKVYEIGGSEWCTFMQNLATKNNYTKPSDVDWSYEYIDYLIYGYPVPTA